MPNGPHLPFPLSNFGTPGKSAAVVHALRASWLDRQWQDLIATITLLRRIEDWQGWCDQALTELVEMDAAARERMLFSPSFASWQQMLEGHIWTDDRAIGPTQKATFRREDFQLFALCAAAPSQRRTVCASVRPKTTMSLPGLGCAIVTTNLGVECRRKGEKIFIEETELPLELDACPLWTQAGSGAGWHLEATPLYEEVIEIGARSPYLTIPFATNGCRFDFSLGDDSAVEATLGRAMDALKVSWLDLWQEVILVNRCLVLYMDTFNPSTVSSFSNSSVPGALFVCPYVDGRTIFFGDLLDSIVHEHAHQKLYLLESLVPLYDENYAETHPSPWKSEPRPIGGVLHGYFVFSILAALWDRVRRDGGILAAYARERVAKLEGELRQAESTLKKHCPFTDAGVEMFDSLRIVCEP